MFYKAFNHLDSVFLNEKMQLKFERSVCIFFRFSREKLPEKNLALEILRETLSLCFKKEMDHDESIACDLENGIHVVNMHYDLFLIRLMHNIDHFDLSPEEYFALFPRSDEEL